MKTIDDIICIAAAVYGKYHIEMCHSLEECITCKFKGQCEMIHNSLNDMIKAGEYH